MQGKCYFIAKKYDIVSHFTQFISLTQLRVFPIMPTLGSASFRFRFQTGG
jgi:hypothetical protein